MTRKSPTPEPRAWRALSDPVRRKVLGLLGLAARSRGLVIGTGRTKESVKEGEVQLVVFAEDSAAGQRKKLLPLLDRREVPYLVVGDREALGRAVGVLSASAVGVTTPSIASEIVKQSGSGPDRQR